MPGDYDLYLLSSSDGRVACDDTNSCATYSAGSGSYESIEFTAEPGAVYYVVWDEWSGDPSMSSAFTLDVDCVVPTCGDGVVEGFEGCDDMNRTSMDGCAADCTVETGYTCTGMPSDCRTICGNGVLEAGETCDDRNTTASDGCTACAIDAGYHCRGLPSSCAMVACGNGTIGRGESCDDSGTTGGDGCSARCAAEIAPRGGSIVIAASLDMSDPLWTRADSDCSESSAGYTYFYDEHYIENATGVSQTVTITTEWASGIDGYLLVYRDPLVDIAPAMGCIDGNDDIERFVPIASRVSSVTIAPGERIVIVATTWNNDTEAGPYRVVVRTDPVCGDGSRNEGETCEDGNTTSGDGCSSRCGLEIATPPGSATLAGTVVATDGSFARPSSACAGPTLPGHRYDAFLVQNASGDNRTVRITGTWGTGDGMILAYDDPFNPYNPTGRCLSGNDDYMGTAQSRIDSLAINAGTAKWIVVTSSTAGGLPIGPYTVSVDSL
jgi:cysteine-rich repeat protein